MDLNTRIFYVINHFARATPWLHPVVAGYAAYGIVLFAVLARTPLRTLIAESATT